MTQQYDLISRQDIHECKQSYCKLINTWLNAQTHTRTDYVQHIFYTDMHSFTEIALNSKISSWTIDKSRDWIWFPTTFEIDIEDLAGNSAANFRHTFTTHIFIEHNFTATKSGQRSSLLGRAAKKLGQFSNHDHTIATIPNARCSRFSKISQQFLVCTQPNTEMLPKSVSILMNHVVFCTWWLNNMT